MSTAQQEGMHGDVQLDVESLVGPDAWSLARQALDGAGASEAHAAERRMASCSAVWCSTGPRRRP